MVETISFSMLPASSSSAQSSQFSCFLTSSFCSHKQAWKIRNMDKKVKKQKKKNDDQNMNTKSNRFLIIVNVFGSAGPIRFIVNEDDSSAAVVETALKLYAREGRLPILGSDVSSFFLYPANAGLDALPPTELIGSRGVRNFVLCKKQINPHMTEARSQVIAQKGGKWRAWLQRSFSLKILSH